MGARELVTLMPAVASIADVRDVDNVLEQCVRALLERVESLEKEVSELRQGDQKRRQEQLRFDNRVVDGLAELHLGQRNTDKDVELLNSDGQTALDMIKDLLDQSEANSGKSVVKKRAKGSSDASAVTQAGTATTNSASSSSRDTITTTRGKTSG